MVVAELDVAVAPRVIYTCLQRGQQSQNNQRVFLIGGMNMKLKSVVHDVFEINLAAKKISKGASLIAKEPMLVPKISFASCVDHTN